MRTLVKLVLAWALATAGAVGLGVLAVGVVTESVTSERPDRLSALAVRNALAVSAPTGPEATVPPGRATSSPATGTPTSRPPATAPPDTGPPATSPPATSPPATSPPTTAATTPSARAAEDRTYQLVGGTVGVRFEDGAARLLWATPKPGFEVDSSGSTDEVDVRFRSDSHESRLRAFWDNGPQSDVEERDA